MSNYASYTIGQDDPQPIPDAIQNPAQQYRNRDTILSVTSIDGVVTETSQTHDIGSVAELNPHHGTDSILATARHPRGLPVYEIEANTLIEVNGVQAPVAFWVKEGVIQKNADGSFSEASSRPQETPEVDTADYQQIGGRDMATVNDALAEVDQGNFDGLAATAIGTAIGRIDPGALLNKFSQVSGHGGEEAQSRVDSIMAIYQGQADSAITARFGIARADLPAFYQWARVNHQGQLHEAVHKQVHQHDVSGYKPMADRWLTSNPPSAAALKAAGYPLRMQGQQQEVFVQGQWMRPEAAARLSMI